MSKDPFTSVESNRLMAFMFVAAPLTAFALVIMALVLMAVLQ